MSRSSALLATVLCVFTLSEVNYPHLSPQSQLAIFSMLALVLGFLNKPLHPRLKDVRALRVLDGLLVLAAIGCGLFIVTQTEPLFRSLWLDGQSLGNRAGQETALDTFVGVVGLLLVVEGTRRFLGSALPILALLFVGYALFGASFPDWLFPHRGYGVERIVAQTFLHSQGVFGTALRVMFIYVCLFVIFGSVLKSSGATQYIIDFARGVFGSSPGGPAKVAVLSSGLMGSLSGSAVANTATTGTFTIPMMRSAGFKPQVAAGIEAAASSGGALVPPVMGAGAYMMLEIVEPPVTYLQIVKAALLPALLYYFSLLLIVHFHARRIGVDQQELPRERHNPWKFEGLVFLAGFASLLLFLLRGYTVFRAVSLGLLSVLIVGAFNARTRIGPRRAFRALAEAGREIVPLVAAAACVGIVIGVVTLTGVGTRLPAAILDLSHGSLLPALLLIMISSIVLGMGLPSAVCYLLMATLVGPVLGQLGVVPLGAHLFIFYFGMMSMVTPPVALAAYTAATIAGSSILGSSLAAFRFALVGFALPYVFIARPALLLMNDASGPAAGGAVLAALSVAVPGVLAFAAAIAGYLFAPLSAWQRGLLFVAAALLMLPDPAPSPIPWTGAGGLFLLAGVALLNRRRR